MSGTRATTSSTLFCTRVDTARMKKAERIFNQLGLKVGDAVNLFLLR